MGVGTGWVFARRGEENVPVPEREVRGWGWMLWGFKEMKVLVI